MIRIGSQLIFCSPERILRRSVIEMGELNTITDIYSLDDGNVETAQTLFFDGILSAGIVSFIQSRTVKLRDNRLNDYQYCDFSKTLPSTEILRTGKSLILDFGTNSTDKINTLLPCLSEVLKAFSIFEIIAACTYHPSLLIDQPAGLKENSAAGLLLWEQVDLTDKKLLTGTQIREFK